jgi:hypothetical protein
VRGDHDQRRRLPGCRPAAWPPRNPTLHPGGCRPARHSARDAPASEPVSARSPRVLCTF